MVAERVYAVEDESRGIDHPWFDSTRAPLYVWTFPPTFTDEELEAALDAHAEWRRSMHRTHTFVIDLSRIRSATATQRWIVARHLRDAASHARAYVCATAIVVPSALHRALMSAVFRIQSPPTPVHVTQSRDAALAYCESHAPPRAP